MIKNDRGSALVLALISLAMLMVLSAGLVTITNNEWRSSKLSVRDLEYKYLAESGIERALAELRRDMLWAPTLGQFQPVDGDQGYKFDQWEWDSARQVFKIKSTAVVAGQPHTSIYVELKPEALPQAFSYAACAGHDFRVTSLLGAPFTSGEIHANHRVLWKTPEPSNPPTFSTDDNADSDFECYIWKLFPPGWSPYENYNKGTPANVLMPLVDWNYYKQSAYSFGRYIRKDDAFLVTIGGWDRLVFAEGSVAVLGIGLERCLLVAQGDVSINGLGVSDLFGTGKLTIIAGGDINFNYLDLNILGKTRIMAYAGGNIHVPLSLKLVNSFKGTLVARGDVEFDSGPNVEYDPSVNDPPPHIYWTTTEPPKIVKWVETKA